MSAKAAEPQRPTTVVAHTRKLTLDDVRRKAENVQQTAKDEVTQVSKRVMGLDQTRVVLYAAVGFAVVAGLAYYMGTRAAGRPPKVVKVSAVPSR